MWDSTRLGEPNLCTLFNWDRGGTLSHGDESSEVCVCTEQKQQKTSRKEGGEEQLFLHLLGFCLKWKFRHWEKLMRSNYGHRLIPAVSTWQRWLWTGEKGVLSKHFKI